MSREEEQEQAALEGARERFDRIWDKLVSEWPRDPAVQRELDMVLATIEEIEGRIR